MLVAGRRTKALDVQAKRDVKYKEMEEQSRIEAKTREVQRKIQIESQKQEYAVIHKQTKNAKRRVNIEIASGICDLMLDLAEECFVVQQG